MELQHFAKSFYHYFFFLLIIGIKLMVTIILIKETVSLLSFFLPQYKFILVFSSEDISRLPVCFFFFSQKYMANGKMH